ncbi:alternate-type signal peptide domain-containing protein [Nocardioides sp. SYSU DS0663]|uniref:alternate-type signal peptide domain-containing protein n=1 Tax=Nocardioides sp. SYSU DS0663 TaxID=3416445 RepID=UPI003F4C762C
MNKTAKGALAAGTAVVLLMGGAGSLAYWTTTTENGTGGFSSGSLTLDSSSCTAATWMRANTLQQASPVVHAEGDVIVPGDSLTKTCTVTVGATGKNLRAALAVTDGELTVTDTTATAGSGYTVTSSFTRGDQPLAFITDEDADKTIDVVITVTLPGGSGNDTMTDQITLSDFVVTATQESAPAAA